MEREFLRNFGLEESQVDSILNENSKDIGKKVNEINGLIKERDDLAEQLKTANSTITTLKNSNKDNESLQQKIAEYKTKIDTMSKEFENERKNNAIISELQNNNFIDPKLAIHLIDSEKVIKAQDGTYTGLTEQIDALINNSQYDYLRNIPKEEPETPATPQVDRGGYNPEVPQTTTANEPTNKEQSLIGEIIGTAMEETAKTEAQGVADFWKSVTV